MHLWIERVASDFKISDLPSRDSYEAMAMLGAVWRPPLIADLLLEGGFPQLARSSADALQHR